MITMNGPSLLKTMAENEPFRNLLNFQIIDIKPGYAKVSTTVSRDMLNIHGITHGGALFGLVDEAFELASNSHGTVAVALNMNITFFAATRIGEILTAEAKEIFRTKRTATYQIQVTSSNGDPVAQCQALVYRKKYPLDARAPSGQPQD